MSDDQTVPVTHRIAIALDPAYTVCCGRSPLVLPAEDLITSKPSNTTCQPGKRIA